MRNLTRVVDMATSALSIVAGIAVVLLMVHVTVDVIFRSGFGISLPGTIAIVQNYYMIFLVCLPLAFVERKDAHISVDVITNLMSRRVQAPLFGWTYLLAALAFGLVAYGSWVEALTQYAVSKFTIEQDIKIPIWIGYFAVPLGYGMGTLYAILRFVRFLTARDAPAEIASAAGDVEGHGHD